ncbi:hypothetical protein JGS22_010360 [Streptomyces sp. P38-E01]|uniref:Uncharacterized protein n=1 Tax=Streptomyces tardus TaxID=2780544 RepID=A0A949JDN4_9ACTN|nr:hypothetical protein [Streptomyces tardus]MBU7598001.1 hypothetical protein [Streptomyces tardus]
MRTVLNGEVHVRYGQIYVESAVWGYAMDEYFAGQSNGLCGAGAPGGLFLNTGLHTGYVSFRVEVLDAEPPTDDSWEDVVEAPFRPKATETLLVEWAGEDYWELDLEEIDYRVRYSAVGMDAARDQDTRRANDPGHDRYLLQFWPAALSPDHVIKQTSQIAAYWHDFARELPAPPSDEERVLLVDWDGRRHQIDEERLRQRVETSAWKGRLPSERLRRVGGNVMGMVTIDRDLLDELEAVPPSMQRSIARWAAYRAYAAAGLAEIGWVSRGLDALDQGRELPPPFDHIDRTWDALFEEEQVPHSIVSSLEGSVPYMLQQAMALPAIFAATDPDPLRAAVDSLYAAAATFGPDYRTLFVQLRLAFPLLTAHTPPPVREPDLLRGLLAQFPGIDVAEDEPRSGAGEGPEDDAGAGAPDGQKDGPDDGTGSGTREGVQSQPRPGRETPAEAATGTADAERAERAERADRADRAERADVRGALPSAVIPGARRPTSTSGGTTAVDRP